MSGEIGVLVMAYGGPGSLDEVEPYLLDVRGGRATPPHVVAEVRERYRKIGGRSPIAEHPGAQAKGIQRALASMNGARFRTVVGMRHWHPYIKDTLTELAQAGVHRAVGVVLAPHYSRLSIGAYFDRAREAGTDVELARIESWHLLPGYLEALAGRVQEALGRFPEAERAKVPVIYTAHSLPQRIREWRDPYVRQLGETVKDVRDRVGMRQPWRFAFQSAGMAKEPWLGPDVGEVLDLVAASGVPGVVIAPVGFVSEHVEILYDIDIELAARARGLGLRLERIRMLNDAPELVRGLAELVRERARGAGWL